MWLRHWIFGAGAAFASSVALASPIPNLQPGLWSFHTSSTYLSGPKKGKVTIQDKKICLTGNKPFKKILKPDINGQTHCDTFRYKTAHLNYRVVMQCRSVTPKMSSKLLKTFTIVPSPADIKKPSKTNAAGEAKTATKNNALLLEGMVRQRLTGTPVASPTVVLKETIQGTRTGKCSG